MLVRAAVAVLAVLLQLLLVSGANRALGLSDELFVLGDSVILTVLGQVSFMPILVLAGRCRRWVCGVVVVAWGVGGCGAGWQVLGSLCQCCLAVL